MTKPFLQQLPITYVDSISLENIGAIFCVKMINREHNLLIFLRNIIVLNFSQNYLNYNKDDLPLIEINHEYRKLTPDDLKKYSYNALGIVDQSSSLHVITLYGNNIFEIICEDVDIEKLDG